MDKTKPVVDVVKVSDLTPDDRNANKHTAGGMALLSESLRRHGFGRPALADKNLRMIAGNATLEQVADAAGVDAGVIIVRTHGDKMIVHVREDLDLEDPETRRLALLDNRVQEQNLDWDPEVLHALDEEGVDLADLWTVDQLDILRSAKFKTTDVAPLPEPVERQKDDRSVEFSKEQWEIVQQSVIKMNAEDGSAGLELSIADVLSILAGRYVEASTS